MWAKFKALPLWVKLVLGCFLIAVAIQSARHDSGPSSTGATWQSGEGRGSAGEDSQKQALLAHYQAQHDQISKLAQQCMQEMNAATQRQAEGAVNGEMVMDRPACEQQAPQWTAQLAFLEAQIYRLQTGDNRTSVRDIAHITDSGSGESSGSTQPPSGESDDGTQAVENWDRAAVRGTTMYIDGNGYQRELPTAKYYYHNRETGRDIASESPYPPNDGYDYEQLTPQN